MFSLIVQDLLPLCPLNPVNILALKQSFECVLNVIMCDWVSWRSPWSPQVGARAAAVGSESNYKWLSDFMSLSACFSSQSRQLHQSLAVTAALCWQLTLVHVFTDGGNWLSMQWLGEMQPRVFCASDQITWSSTCHGRGRSSAELNLAFSKLTCKQNLRQIEWGGDGLIWRMEDSLGAEALRGPRTTSNNILFWAGGEEEQHR